MSETARILPPLDEGSLKSFLSSHRGGTVSFQELLEHDGNLAHCLLEAPEVFFEACARLNGGKQIRIGGLPITLTPDQIRAEHVGRFVQVEGLVTRISEVRQEVTVAAYRCLFCGYINEVPQDGSRLRGPVICENPNCGKTGSYAFKFDPSRSRWRNWQAVRIQEKPEVLSKGRTPRHLDLVLRDELVGIPVPGNHIVATGTVNVRNQGKQTDRVFVPYLDVNHLEVLSKGVEETELSPEDEAWVREVSSRPDYIPNLIASIAPSIQGYEHIKEAVALQLFGADTVTLKDGTRLRGNIHILLVGDPAVSKTQILKWVARAGFRGVYASGKKSTGVGLTAAVVRDELTGGWNLEAGAVVLADGGTACLDELGEIDAEERAALLEAMESQTVTIHKASIHATLNARTSVLAAANPKGGRFDTKNRNILEQVDLDPPLLSRFDLIFFIRDQPDLEKDKRIAEKIIGARMGEEEAPFTPEQIRKLVVYARRIHPKLQGKLTDEIVEKYLRWRRGGTDETPAITPRQLEALLRLAFASARMRMSSRVEREDVERAERLLSAFLREVGVDVATGKLDIDLIMTGKPKSAREKLVALTDLFEKMLSEGNGKEVDLREFEERAVKAGIEKWRLHGWLEEAKARGEIYEPEPGKLAKAWRW